ncbi:N-acetylmuramoyl-L-alanine amidase [Paenalcaligenes niemegkensis]|uniref:N-acetylmuramoyl-L-alanine amidase n=1 Tax=Paenalcaligenes niemegkensis TaxID=2895469 RepID=UPI001EE850DD|nr:N-acetylmuramoyl-L-alanine amidase [Paenalcaligenes niemegkensis]MCQ9616895.1 N-acetylmuramoyl-L-alanine amidase [Paenalcaligenes niemegkensis]
MPFLPFSARRPSTSSFVLVMLVAAVLSGCSSAPRIGNTKVDDSIQAQGQNSRVRHIVLHYTSGDTPTSLKVLSQHDVSSHYLISDDSPPKLYKLVDENRRAWHAGVGRWGEYSDLNTSSVGIEIVNEGRRADGTWAPYQKAQIDLAIALIQDLVNRHRVTPSNIVGHSDIAPQRKIDPGPLFPWAQLAEAGLGRWYNETQAAQYQQRYQTEGLPGTYEIQELLKSIGYDVSLNGELDRATINVIAAFQMRYRPGLYDGNPDAQTVGILKALSTSAR